MISQAFLDAAARMYWEDRATYMTSHEMVKLDHLCEDTSSFEEELEEKRPYRHTTKENSDFFRGGKGARMFDKGKNYFHAPEKWQVN